MAQIAPPIYNNVKVYFPANNGKVIEADVLQMPTLSLGNVNGSTWASPRTSTQSAACSRRGSDASMRSCMPGPCTNTDVAWAAGDAGKLFNPRRYGLAPGHPGLGHAAQHDPLYGVASGLYGQFATPWRLSPAKTASMPSDPAAICRSGRRC